VSIDIKRASEHPKLVQEDERQSLVVRCGKWRSEFRNIVPITVGSLWSRLYTSHTWCFVRMYVIILDIENEVKQTKYKHNFCIISIANANIRFYLAVTAYTPQIILFWVLFGRISWVGRHVTACQLTARVSKVADH